MLIVIGVFMINMYIINDVHVTKIKIVVCLRLHPYWFMTVTYFSALNKMSNCKLFLSLYRKHTLNCHRMKPALFSVLCEIKEKTGRILNQSQYFASMYRPRDSAVFVFLELTFLWPTSELHMPQKNVRFEVLTAVKMSMFYGFVTPC